jgi:hypothetical protein
MQVECSLKRNGFIRGGIGIKNASVENSHPLRSPESLNTPSFTKLANSIFTPILNNWFTNYLGEASLFIQVTILISHLIVPLIN